MIEISNLKKSYGSREVLSIDKLNFSPGEVVGILGNNGAGKTTLFNLLLDLVERSSGSVRSKDMDVAQSEAWKQYTSAFLDESFLISFLSPEEYFDFIGGLYGMKTEAVAAFLSPFERIFNGEIMGRKKFIRDLSKGNQKKVGLIASLMGSPEIVIWDEPFANLDPSAQVAIKQLVLQRDPTTCFLISSHDLNHVYEVCDRIIIVSHGKVMSDMQRSECSLEGLIGHFSP